MPSAAKRTPGRRLRAQWRVAGARARGLARAVRGRWDGLAHWQKHWVWNILIGIAIELVLIGASGTRLVVGLQSWAMDTTQKALAAASPAYVGAIPPITIIDVDEETWRDPAWSGGEPYRAPRAQLATLLAYAQAGSPRHVVIDVIVENPAGPDDAEFARTISEAAARLKGQQHIILVRTMREPLVEAEGLAPQLRTSPLDAVIAKSGGRLVEAAPYFEVSRDGVLRDWRLWRAACAPDPPGPDGAVSGLGRWRVLPSVQLAIVTLDHRLAAPWNRTGPGKRCLASPEAMGSEVTAPESAIDRDTLKWLQAHRELTGREIEAHHGSRLDPASRIFFADAAPPTSGRIQIVSALKVLKDDHVPKHFDDAVVIIGQSSEAARDTHATPVGPMPGAMVLANALESLREHGLVQPAPEWFEWAFLALSIVLVGLVFARLDSVVGTLAIAVPFLLFLAGANYLMLRSGFWFDFALPLVGLYAHRLVTTFEEYLSLRRYRAEAAAKNPSHTSEGET